MDYDLLPVSPNRSETVPVYEFGFAEVDTTIINLSSYDFTSCLLF
jgi:hypothetical protein